MGFIDDVKKRRSRYKLSNRSSLSEDALRSLLGDSLLHAPTAFNAQSGRIVLALSDHHDAVWNLVMEALSPSLSDAQREKTRRKIDGFKAAYGTILFFEDEAVVESLQKRFPLYAEAFSEWSHQAQGMLQYIVWTSLATAGMGASLQHYNPIVDDALKKHFAIKDAWRLTAQMPFGISLEEPAEKDKEPLEKRLIIHR